MLSKKMHEALNQQINSELYSAYLYLSMSSYFRSINLNGFAKWMRVQFQEELAHALKICDYVEQRRARVLLQPIGGPSIEWSSPLGAFEDALKHEQKVTGMIHGLVKLANGEGDHATDVFLQWFVSEQVEEEASVDEVAQKLKLVGNDPSGLLLIDHELGKRGSS